MFRLLEAAETGDIEQLKSLIAAGADVNAQDRDGLTALRIAVKEGQPEAVRLLCDQGADVNAKDNAGRTPLSYAAGRHDRREIAELLRRHGAEDPVPMTTADHASG